MGIKLADIPKHTYHSKKDSMPMQSKLMLYWITMLLVIFGALLVIFYIMGIFSGTEQKMHQVLRVHHDSVTSTLKEQVNLLTARGIYLAEEAADRLDTLLYGEPTSKLNNDSEQIRQLEEEFYTKLNTALRSSPCNGVYLVMDTTINTEIVNAKTSRAGLYLRYVNLSTKNSIHQDVALFRGIADVARKNNVELHNRWKMEFDSSIMVGYAESLTNSSGKLLENCYWTPRVQLTDTWEDMLMLVVPIPGSSGQVRGICGVELGELYLQLSYPAQESKYGNMVTVVAPMEGNMLMLSQGLTGEAGGTFLNDLESLYVKEGELFHTYSSDYGTFLGLHTKLDMNVVGGNSMYAVTLIPAEGYQTAKNMTWIQWIVISAIFLAGMMAVAVFLSHRFVHPIRKSIVALNSDMETELQNTGISEIDTLMTFLRQKEKSTAVSSLPADVEELFHTFSENAKDLTITERNILKYYSEGREVAKVAELSFISIHTVRKHNLNIYRKLKVSSREEVILYLELFKRCGRLEEILQER